MEMLRYTVLRATIGILTIALLVTVPRAATEQSSGLDAGELTSDEEPIIIVPEDVCDIEVDPTAVDLLLVDPLNFYATYMLPVPCEPPPAQYKCQGCRDKRGTVYECYHETMDPSIPCDPQYCIKNVFKAKSCYVSGAGAEDCRVLFDKAGGVEDDNYIVQHVVKATPKCNTDSQQPSHWMSFWAGCPRCVETKIEIRCKTRPELCRGTIVQTFIAQGRYFCSPNPCPP